MGQPLAGGIAIGRIAVYGQGHPPEIPKYRIDPSDIEHEVTRFQRALDRAREELQEVEERLSQEMGRDEAAILQVHGLMLLDPSLRLSVEEKIIQERVNVEAALDDVIRTFSRVLASTEEDYMRERAIDILDVGRRVLSKLLFVEGMVAPLLSEERIIAADVLSPAMTAHLEREKILGFAAEAGGVTSHAAILARSLGIPAVSGLPAWTSYPIDSDWAILDGFSGLLILHPEPSTLSEYEHRQKRFHQIRAQITAEVAQPAVTLDGHAIRIMANLRGSGDHRLPELNYLDGVGLYRTEFLFLRGDALPSEDEQVKAYAEAIETMGDKGVTIRILDIGGDKFLPYFVLPKENNPFLGLRGLRVLIDHPALFKSQFRAILRASVYGRTGIMYPMVNGLEDLLSAQGLLQEAKEELRREGVPFDDDIAEGAMIETPAAVEVLDLLLPRLDFISVGTNDLIQYLLAVDRGSEHVVRYYDPLHPAVLRTLNRIQQRASEAGKPVSICGEIAGDPIYTPLLLGLGYRALSMNVVSSPYIKHAIRMVTLSACEQLAEQALSLPSSKDIKERMAQLPTNGLGELTERPRSTTSAAVSTG